MKRLPHSLKSFNVFDTVRAVGRLLPVTRKSYGGQPVSQPGHAPGIAHLQAANTPPETGAIQIEIIDYDTNNFSQKQMPDIESALAEPLPEGQWRWLNISGLHPYVVKKVQEQYRLHSLVAEDILNCSVRPKAERYADHLFTVMRMFQISDNSLNNEQVSFYLMENTLVTFQEIPGDVWNPVRERMKAPDSRFRKNGLPYLLYALLDAIVDHCFPILEAYSAKLDEIEEQMLIEQGQEIQWRIHVIKRELGALGRVLFPMREVIDRLCRSEEGAGIPEVVRTYLRDVHDHALQVKDLVESCRDTAASLNELYLSSVSHRMNEVMKVLTIMASLFIPITFIAGVYGMNFEYIPELSWHYSYPVFWVTCIGVVTGLLVYFRRKGWF